MIEVINGWLVNIDKKVFDDIIDYRFFLWKFYKMMVLICWGSCKWFELYFFWIVVKCVVLMVICWVLF